MLIFCFVGMQIFTLSAHWFTRPFLSLSLLPSLSHTHTRLLHSLHTHTPTHTHTHTHALECFLMFTSQFNATQTHTLSLSSPHRRPHSKYQSLLPPLPKYDFAYQVARDILHPAAVKRRNLKTNICIFS